jgi:predicted ATPase
VGDDQQLFAVLDGLRACYHVRGELQRARRLAERLLALARIGQDDELLMAAHRALGASCFNLGNLAAARAHFEQVLALYNPDKHHRHVFRYGLDPGVFCHAYLGWALWHLGYPDQALERGRQAQSLARTLGYPFVQIFALVLNAELHLHCRDGPQAQCWAEAAIALAGEHGYTFFDDWATIMQGAALAEQGQLADGIERMRRGLRDYQATGSGLWRLHFLALLADACGKAGRPAEGMEVLTEARTELGRSGEHLYEVELQRIRGDLLLAGAAGAGAKALDAAQRCYTGALAVARRQGTRSLALRVTLSLGRLYRQRGRSGDARRLLGEIDSEFTEGADTADRRAARALLAELSNELKD